jgi:hypothetical protein
VPGLPGPRWPGQASKRWPAGAWPLAAARPQHCTAARARRAATEACPTLRLPACPGTTRWRSSWRRASAAGASARSGPPATAPASRRCCALPAPRWACLAWQYSPHSRICCTLLPSLQEAQVEAQRQGPAGGADQEAGRSQHELHHRQVSRGAGQPQHLAPTSQSPDFNPQPQTRRRRFREAARVLMEVVQEVPNLQDPYHTLGLIHEALHEPRKALDFYMIAAHLAPKVAGRWGGGRGGGAHMGACVLQPRVAGLSALSGLGPCSPRGGGACHAPRPAALQQRLAATTSAAPLGPRCLPAPHSRPPTPCRTWACGAAWPRCPPRWASSGRPSTACAR